MTKQIKYHNLVQATSRSIADLSEGRGLRSQLIRHCFGQCLWIPSYLMPHSWTVAFWCFSAVFYLAKLSPDREQHVKEPSQSQLQRAGWFQSLTLSPTLSDVHVTHSFPSSLCLMFSKVLITLGSFLEPQGIYCTNHGNIFRYEFPCPFIENTYTVCSCSTNRLP